MKKFIQIIKEVTTEHKTKKEKMHNFDLKTSDMEANYLSLNSSEVALILSNNHN